MTITTTPVKPTQTTNTDATPPTSNVSSSKLKIMKDEASSHSESSSLSPSPTPASPPPDSDHPEANLDDITVKPATATADATNSNNGTPQTSHLCTIKPNAAGTSLPPASPPHRVSQSASPTPASPSTPDGEFTLSLTATEAAETIDAVMGITDVLPAVSDASAATTSRETAAGSASNASENDPVVDASSETMPSSADTNTNAKECPTVLSSYIKRSLSGLFSDLALAQGSEDDDRNQSSENSQVLQEDDEIIAPPVRKRSKTDLMEGQEDDSEPVLPPPDMPLHNQAQQHVVDTSAAGMATQALAQMDIPHDDTNTVTVHNPLTALLADPPFVTDPVDPEPTSSLETDPAFGIYNSSAATASMSSRHSLPSHLESTTSQSQSSPRATRKSHSSCKSKGLSRRRSFSYQALNKLFGIGNDDSDQDNDNEMDHDNEHLTTDDNGNLPNFLDDPAVSTTDEITSTADDHPSSMPRTVSMAYAAPVASSEAPHQELEHSGSMNSIMDFLGAVNLDDKNEDDGDTSTLPPASIEDGWYIGDDDPADVGGSGYLPSSHFPSQETASTPSLSSPPPHQPADESLDTHPGKAEPPALPSNGEAQSEDIAAASDTTQHVVQEHDEGALDYEQAASTVDNVLGDFFG